MAKSAWIVNVAGEDFQREVIERSKETPVVVDFWTPWCAPCRALGPLLEKLVKERNGDIVLAKVNIDEAQDLAARFEVMSIPTVIAFRDGQPVLDFVGVLPESELQAFFDRIAPSRADRLARQAKPLEIAQPAQAETLYREALDLDRNHETAMVGLARVLIDQGQCGEARELLENLAAAGELAEEAERLQALLFLREQAASFGSEDDIRRRLAADPTNARSMFELGSVLAASARYPDALEQLLAAGQRDHSLAASAVRETMVKIFQLIGVRSALADDYRDKLTALLY